MAVDLTEANLHRTGAGDAFLWGQNKSLQGLQQVYQQEQLRKQKEEAEMADQLSKINTDSVRDADLPQVMKSYGELKNTFAKIRGTTNQMDRIRLQAQLNQQKTELSRAVSLSKAAAQQEADLGKIPLTNPDNVSDDFVPSYSKLRTLSVFDPNYKTQAEYIAANGVLPKFDNNAYSKILLDRSIENVQGPEQRKKDDRLNFVVREEGSRLNEGNILKNAAKAYVDDRKFQRFINTNYKGLSPEQAIQQYSKELYEANKDAYNKVKEKNVRQFMDPAPDRFYEHYNYQLAHPKAPQFIGVPQPMVIPFGKQGKDVVGIPDYVPLSIPEKNFAGSEFIDMKTGKPSGKLKSSSDNQVVGVGNVFIIKQGTQKGSLAQPNFAKEHPEWVEQQPMIHVQQKVPGGDGLVKDLLLPYRTLPLNIKNSKQIREALSGFKPATPSKQSSQTAPSKGGKKQIKGWN